MMRLIKINKIKPVQIAMQEGSSHSRVVRKAFNFSTPQGDDLRRGLKIPLISKRMNSVEKYINKFNMPTENISTVSRDQGKSGIAGDSKSVSGDRMNHYRSVDISGVMGREGFTQPVVSNFCVKYDSIVSQKSQEKLQVLSKLEKDYVLLKQKMQPKSLRSYRSTERRPVFRNEEAPHITSEEVEKELKNSMVNEDGRNYYADLYLLKKGREKIMDSLSNMGKFSLEQNQSYEEKAHAREQQFVKSKIIREREVKKSKMLRGRNLHWNVYYDMLALSTAEKQKLKGTCKFTTTFGIA